MGPCYSCCLLSAPYTPGVMMPSFYFVCNSHVGQDMCSLLTGAGVIGWPTSQRKEQGQRNCLRHTALKVHGRCRTQEQVCPIQNPASQPPCNTACIQIDRLEFEPPLLKCQAECLRLSLTPLGLSFALCKLMRVLPISHDWCEDPVHAGWT